MKAIPPFLLLLFLTSCSHPPPPDFRPWAPSPAQGPAPAAVARPRPATAPERAPETAVTKPAVTAVSPARPAETNAASRALLAQRQAAARAMTNTAASVTPVPPPATAPRPTPPPPATTAAQPARAAAAKSSDIIPAGTIDFPATDLNQVLQIYAELVNRTVLRPANLPAPLITLKTQTPLTKKEAIQAFDAVLALNGIAMINVGDKFVKAVPVAQAIQEAGPFNTNKPSQLPDLGQYVTHVVQLQHVLPSKMVQVLQPFAKAPNAILPIDDSQILVLRDYAENVKRMLQMVKKVDVAVPAEFVSAVIPIKYAKATDIANALNSLSEGGGSTTIGGGASAGATQGFGTGAGYMRSGTAGGYNRGMTGYTRGTSMYGPQSEDITPIASFTPQAVAPTPARGTSFTDRLRQIIGKASGGNEKIQVLGPTRIIADARSNSLLIFATRQDMETIKNIVSKLDVVLAQVLIQTIIMDVQLDNGWNVGLTGAQNPKQFTPDVAGGGGINNGQSFFNQFLGDVSSATTNAFLGSLPGGFSYWAQLGKVWNVALQAAASDERINVIQRPQILTTHATPGSIFIGSTVPYITSTYYGAYGGGPSSSYQQLQVGIGLTVTPYINSDGLVVMQIDESIDELSGSTAITGVGNVPNTTSRRLSAEVAVPDGDTIMLGGFIRNSSDRKRSGVPLLKDIPLLGPLFSNNSNTKERKELIVLMRPTVLKNPEAAVKVTAEQKASLPGVLGAEAQIRADEQKEMEMERKKAYSRKTPLTPEEKKLYGPPPGSGQ